MKALKETNVMMSASVVGNVSTVRGIAGMEMSDVLSAMEMLVESTNHVVFGGKDLFVNLPYFVTIQSRGKRRAYGWVSADMKWCKDKKAMAYELNICAETMDRPLSETFLTIVHELVHLHNIELGDKDTSRNGQFHNDVFDQASMLVGLKNDKDKKNGYITNHDIKAQDKYLQDCFAKVEQECKHVVSLLTISRAEEPEKEKKAKKASNQIKYTCPNCQNSVRSTKKLALLCGDCYKATKALFEMVAEASVEAEEQAEAEKAIAEANKIVIKAMEETKAQAEKIVEKAITEAQTEAKAEKAKAKSTKTKVTKEQFLAGMQKAQAALKAKKAQAQAEAEAKATIAADTIAEDKAQAKAEAKKAEEQAKNEALMSSEEEKAHRRELLAKAGVKNADEMTVAEAKALGKKRAKAIKAEKAEAEAIAEESAK